ncbi:outer membrane protein assembly factor [Vibrio sp. SCSIO 43136]|uniref:outer membrane protein assembly factor n=1 Tax=Vibrio sp. SCSIO 43136 TaxID=2819101 RepID=UPI00207509F3|nr:outer membrane protein assembly factor [Vibrio sp. SCSIO 43136]USD67074.1 hypothetical protein J4N39_20785 [Vibrio sp. SCSIO 43136]
MKYITPLVVPLIVTTSVYASAANPESDEQHNLDQKVEETQSLWGTKFAVLPQPITDPALGRGIGLTALYIHDRAEGATNPSTSFAYGQWTDTNSGVAVVGHEHNSAFDEWRGAAYLGYIGLNLTHYGHAGAAAKKPLRYTNNAKFFYGNLKKRLIENLYFGVQGMWSGGNAVTKNDKHYTEQDRARFEEAMSGTNSALGLILSYDKRDNMMSAREGYMTEISSMHYEARETGKPYHRVDAEFSQFIPVADKDVFAYKAMTAHLLGSVPSYEMVTPELRGIDWNKSRGTSVYQLEAEYRHAIDEKWTGVAFAGAAYVETQFDAKQKAASEWIPAGGIGVRYMMEPTERFSIGFDYAITKGGESNYYIRFGEAF